MGFTLQSILKRVPIIVSPIAGGALIASIGVVAGVRYGLLVTLALAAITALLLTRVQVRTNSLRAINIIGVWQSFPRPLKRLLTSDAIIRTCEALTGVLVILYVTNVHGLNAAYFGVFVAIQMIASLLGYIPAARLADRIGRKPLVIATFVNFALFPVAIILASNVAWLAVAFVIGGLREIGEPARKAMIVDLAQENVRARSIGLYYLIRSLSITPAAAIGGLLWSVNPKAPFIAAGIVGLLGTIVFALTVEERYAS